MALSPPAPPPASASQVVSVEQLWGCCGHVQLELGAAEPPLELVLPVVDLLEQI
jgi:hypothetical protein